jgi:hypothetical protein
MSCGATATPVAVIDSVELQPCSMLLPVAAVLAGERAVLQACGWVSP